MALIFLPIRTRWSSSGVSYGQSGTSDYGQPGAYGDASEYAPGTYGAGDGVVGAGAADYEAAAWLELTPRRNSKLLTCAFNRWFSVRKRSISAA